jgi:hypothetical protein
VRSWCFDAAYGELSDTAIVSKPSAGRITLSPWLIHTSVVDSPIESSGSTRTIFSSAGPNSLCAARLTSPPKAMVRTFMP